MEAAPDIPRPTTVSHTAAAHRRSDGKAGPGGRRLARELLQVSIKDDRQDADARIRDRGQQERRSDAECRYQMEAGSIGAQDRAERIQGVQPTHLPAQDIHRANKEPAEYRQRRAHEGSGDQEDQEDEQELEQAEGKEGQPERPVEGDVDVFSPRKKERGDECVDPDPDLDESVESKRVGVSVGYPSEQVTPQAQAGHEGG